MAISLDHWEEVRGAYEGRGVCEDVLHECPNPSYVGNNLAMYSRRKDSAGHDNEKTSRRKTSILRDMVFSTASLTSARTLIENKDLLARLLTHP